MSSSIRPRRKKAKFLTFLSLVFFLGGLVWWLSRNEVKPWEKSAATVVEKLRFHEQQALMGTTVQITVYAEDEEIAQAAMKKAFLRGEMINQIASDYLPDSELSRFNRSPVEEWFEASSDFVMMVGYAVELAEQTEGAFDPTLGTATHLWRETKKSGVLPANEVLQAALEASGWQKIEVDFDQSRVRRLAEGLRLDLGGLAKGYAADQMLASLQSSGLPQSLVVIGGDVRCGLAPPNAAGWVVGLRGEKGEIAGTISVSECAVSTSGDLEQFVVIDSRRYSHIIDSKTGLGLTDSLMATVVAENGLMADPLATAACVDPLFFRDLPGATKIHSRILSGGMKQVSDSFPAVTPLLAGEEPQ
ncbi:FAD:protein FMN transferase [Roseibacillus ishigakijimensis]|uniref:FAD:protein FMN transferase n=1 Tax=Roseibacillus ishigakijimensis TaxID=454146 RepID=A0A934RQR2_9BACT|nr:FAD:protein FMN transferase [Roseibacillus ishigakijimensis]MBK1832530.1 FAD:protein FMN transferase [Roseibacillus ishigakijimensis]